MLNELIRYFDLQSGQRRLDTRAHSTESAPAHAPVLPQYLVVCFGVIVEPFLRFYIANGRWDAEWSAVLGRAVFGLIVGIVLLPSVYKSAFDTEKPIMVQLAALFPMGIGWQALFATATAAVGK